MTDLIESPLLIVLGALGYSLLSVPRLKHHLLAHLGRVVAIGLVILPLYQQHLQSQRKVCAAQKKLGARDIAEFAMAVQELVKAGHATEAQALLVEFAKDIEAISGDDLRMREFVDGLTARASANKAL